MTDALPDLLTAIPADPTQRTPPRRAGSIRRTSTIDARWPGGLGTETVLSGRARDLITPSTRAARVNAEDTMQVIVGPDSRIGAVITSPAVPGIEALVGAPSMSGYRAQLAEHAPATVASCRPLHLLLDDIPGASLVSNYAPLRWRRREDLLVAAAPALGKRVVRDVCVGLRTGSTALREDGTARLTRTPDECGDLTDGSDPQAWHELASTDGMSFRRSRRLDVWLDGDVVGIDGFFQDSATMPDGSRQSLHEYTLHAQADLETGTLRGVQPVPRSLPHTECPLAVAGASTLVGRPLAEFRPTALRALRGTAGCTHLTDMLRSLADVPTLVAALLAEAG